MRSLTVASVKLAFGLVAVTISLAAQNPPAGGQAATNTAGEAAQAAKPDATKADASGLPVAVDPKTFKLGPEDVIMVRVWREPDLSGPVVIQPDGKIVLPIIDEVQAAGLTPQQLSESLAKSLSQYIKEPQVIVQVQAVRSKKYYISGEINRPGAYPLPVPVRVFDAITLAGGFRDFANKKNIVVIRDNGTKRFKFNYNDIVKGKKLDQNILLQDGDQIIVP
jgi:polysaccharide export outer membrane protein